MSTLVNLLLAAVLQILGVQVQEKINEERAALKKHNIQVVQDTAAVENKSTYCMELCKNHPSKNEQNLNEINTK